MEDATGGGAGDLLRGLGRFFGVSPKNKSGSFDSASRDEAARGFAQDDSIIFNLQCARTEALAYHSHVNVPLARGRDA